MQNNLVTKIDMPNLYQEALDHFNEPVLIGSKLCRLIGYSEDDEDCYFITDDQSRGVTYYSCVGGFMSLRLLKEQGITIPTYPEYPGEVWTDYSRLDNLLELNGVPKREKFELHIKQKSFTR
jgi:hypothetical protein